MRVSTLSIPLFAIVICVDALATGKLLGHRVLAISSASFAPGLDKRQINIGSESYTPSQCASTCSPVNNEINLGCPVTACCTTTFETQYYNCLECVGAALDASNYAAAQSNINLLYMTCVDMGFVLPQLVLPGQKANDSSSDSGSAIQPFPTGSSGAIAGGSSMTTSGATSTDVWSGIQVEELIGVAVLLGVAVLW